MPSQPQPPEQFDCPEPRFSPEDPLEQRLLTDGLEWRAHSAPAIAPFAERVNAALLVQWHTIETAHTSPEERPMAQQIVNSPPPLAAQQPKRRGPGTWSTLLAIAAAIAIVATLAWVFQALPNSRVAAPSATPTPNPAAHVTHARGHWTDVVRYTVGSESGLYAVPSDPRIAYRAGAAQSNPTAYTLKRTSDGGATWTTLALPTDDGGWFGGLLFSPLDAQTVFLTLFSDQNNPHCPAYALGPGTDVGPGTLPGVYADPRLGPLHPTSGGYSCSFQYVSRDGGAHWSHPTFPWPAQHFADIGSNGFPGPAQGGRLFAAVTGNLNGEAFDGVRLVASDDGGSTWTAADTAIYAAGQIVTSYTAISGTTSLYAMSVPQQTPAGQESSAALWSSEDGGVHWTRVGLAPIAQAELAGTASTPGGPTLYAIGLRPVGPNGPLPVYASRTGGRAWSPVTTAGQPQGQSDDPRPLDTMADGSLLMKFTDPPVQDNSILIVNTNVSFYAWRPGDTEWFPVTPRPGGSGAVTQAWLTSPADGPQALWIVVQSADSRTFTVRKCVLQ